MVHRKKQKKFELMKDVLGGKIIKKNRRPETYDVQLNHR